MNATLTAEQSAPPSANLIGKQRSEPTYFDGLQKFFLLFLFLFSVNLFNRLQQYGRRAESVHASFEWEKKRGFSPFKTDLKHVR